jgi:hypothetical protein
MKSSFKTVDDKDNLSIEYKNLYVINGHITYMYLKGTEVPPSVNIFTNTSQWRPILKTFDDENSLNEYISSLQITDRIELAGLGDNWWYGNIGHALFDGLYPIYLAMVKFGYADSPFTLLSDNLDNKLTMSYDIMKRFCGNIVERYKISHSKIVHIDTLVAGTGRTGNRVINEEYTLYGKKYNGVMLFRNRLLKTYGIKTDKAINGIPKVIIINNKRFSKEERDVINNAVKYFEGSMDIKFVDWYHHFKSFDDQILMFQDVDIQVTGPGTAMMYTPFLKLGAVNINLGYMEKTQTGGRDNIKVPGDTTDYVFPGWMEQCVCAGADYVHTIYYDRSTYNNIEYEPLIDIIKKGVSILYNPSLHHCNHNNDALAFIEYCKRSELARNVCDHLTSIAYFMELFVHEHPLATPKNITNISLLREIKAKYNIDDKYRIRRDFN